MNNLDLLCPTLICGSISEHRLHCHHSQVLVLMLRGLAMRVWPSSYATGQASSTIATEHGNAASCDTCDAVATVTATAHDEAVSSSSSATQQTSCITSSGQVISVDKAIVVCAGPAPRPDTSSYHDTCLTTNTGRLWVTRILRNAFNPRRDYTESCVPERLSRIVIIE